MWRHALRRAFFRLVGLFLLTVPIFAALRYAAIHASHTCLASPSEPCSDRIAIHVLTLPREGFGYLVWQTGAPPWDYWPLAVMLLGLAGGIDLLLVLRARLARRGGVRRRVGALRSVRDVTGPILPAWILRNTSGR